MVDSEGWDSEGYAEFSKVSDSVKRCWHSESQMIEVASRERIYVTVLSHLTGLPFRTPSTNGPFH